MLCRQVCILNVLPDGRRSFSPEALCPFVRQRNVFPSSKGTTSSKHRLRKLRSGYQRLTAAGGTERRKRTLKQAAQALNITFVSAEVAPWSKTGGLGDVVGGLPVELARRGHKVATIAPRYDQHWDAWDTSVTAEVEGEEVRYFHTVKDGVDRIWVDHPWFLAKVWGKTGSKLYGAKSGSDFADNQRRFLLFNKAALKALEVLPFSPGTKSIVVANDWHTAILPVLVKEVYQKNGQYESIKCALCIHNIAFQGRFWKKDWPVLGLPERVQPLFDFSDGYPRVYAEGEPDDEQTPSVPVGTKFEKLNWLKAGILTADKLFTVSPNYATEIAEDDEKGVELADVIREAGGLEGIVNGCDVLEWSPFLDKFLDVKYDVETMEEGKAVAKETLQAELGLAVDPNVPLFGFIGRLEEQKGVDILIDALPAVAKDGGIQVVVLGTGKKSLETQVLQLDKQFPDVVKGVVKFNVPLAHLITAGADFMLVPSRFEPCGLIQLHAMNYGTVPVVSSTGGLVDTVKDGVTGFHAGRFNPDKLDKKDSQAFGQAIRRAAEAFPTAAFQTMQERCIVQELSWEVPAKKWEAALEELWAAPRGARPQAPLPVARSRPEAAARTSAFPTPVQEVDREGAAVPPNAVARKAAASQAVKEQVEAPAVSQSAVPAVAAKPISGGAPSAGPAHPPPPASPAATAVAPTESASSSQPKAQAAGTSSSAGSAQQQSEPLKAAAQKETNATATATPAATASKASSNGSSTAASNGSKAGASRKKTASSPRARKSAQKLTSPNPKK